MACNTKSFTPKTEIRAYLLEKGISYHIFSALFMLGGEGKSLKKLNSFSVPDIEFGLDIEEL